MKSKYNTDMKILECIRCGYKWSSRKPKLPTRCPGCGSTYWNKPYVNGPKAQKEKKQ